MTNSKEKVLLEKLVIAELVKKFPAFMEIKGILTFSQKPASVPFLSQLNPVYNQFL
jgi:hypothetical protein